MLDENFDNLITKMLLQHFLYLILIRQT